MTCLQSAEVFVVELSLSNCIAQGKGKPEDGSKLTRVDFDPDPTRFWYGIAGQPIIPVLDRMHSTGE